MDLPAKNNKWAYALSESDMPLWVQTRGFQNLPPMDFLGILPLCVQPWLSGNLTPMDFLAFQPLWVQPRFSGNLTPND
jgi:hypothetical protein